MTRDTNTQLVVEAWGQGYLYRLERSLHLPFEASVEVLVVVRDAIMSSAPTRVTAFASWLKERRNGALTAQRYVVLSRRHNRAKQWQRIDFDQNRLFWQRRIHNVDSSRSAGPGPSWNAPFLSLRQRKTVSERAAAAGDFLEGLVDQLTRKAVA